MPSYQEQTGTRNDYTAIDSSKILSELSKGNFAISSSASTYTPEIYTIGYISSIFTAKDAIEEFWNNCVSFVSSYIEEFKNIPDPETVTQDTSFLDGTQGNENGTQTGYIVADGTQYVDANGKVLGTLGLGTAVTAVAKTTDQKWIKIKLDNGEYAYVSYNSLGGKSSGTTVNNQPKPTVTDDGVTGYISADGTEYVDANGKVLGTLGLGTAVTAVAKTTDQKWIKIKLDNGEYAYVPYNSLSSKSSGTTVTTSQNTTPKQVTPGKGLTDGKYDGMNYYSYEPDQDGTQKSLTVFLYGSEEGKGSISNLTKYGLGKNLKNGQKYDGHILLLQGWDTQKINSMIDKYVAENNIDPNRISIAGYSRGASAAAELVRKNPNKFSAAAFIGSSVNDEDYVSSLSSIPTKFISGKRDSGATTKSQSMSDKLTSVGGNSTTQVYSDEGHQNKIVTRAYNDGLYDWLTSQSRAKTT